MAQSVRDLDVLQQYLAAVMNRAAHHAPNVEDIALCLIGAIIWRKDAGPIEIFERDGETKNVIWCLIGGRRFAFTYNHDAQAIEVKEDSTRGAVLASFSNSSTAHDVREFFSAL